MFDHFLYIIYKFVFNLDLITLIYTIYQPLPSDNLLR